MARVRSYAKKRLFYPEMIHRIMNPIVIVIIYAVMHLIFNEPWHPVEKLLLVIIFSVSYFVFKSPGLGATWRDIARESGSQVLAGWMQVLGLLALIGFVTGSIDDISHSILIIWALWTPLILLPLQVFGNILINRIFYGEGAVRKSVVVLGASHTGARLGAEIRQDRFLGMDFRGYFEDRELNRVEEDDRNWVLGRTEDVPQYVKEHNIDLVYIALPITKQKRIMDLLDQLRDTTASVYFIPDVFIYDMIQTRFDTINGIPAVAVCETPFYGNSEVTKRLFDMVFSLFVLCLLSPVMLAIVLAVKLTSPGPVIFVQKRYGLDGKEINVYKFRSMKVCENGPIVLQAVRGDPRFTKVGAFLRRSSLDELPQFVNVLQGRMSVVGPRPHAVVHNEYYRKLLAGYMLRHKVKPGITGLAQVSGYRGETKELVDMEKRMEMDLDYLRGWSLTFDLMIILKTISVIFRDVKAY